MEDSKNEKSEKYFFLILAAVHLLYFFYALSESNIYVGDYRDYLYQATNIKEHLNWYSGIYEAPFLPDLYSKRPPMYGFFIFLIKSLYNSDYLVTFIQSCLSFLNFFGLIKLLKTYKLKVNIYRLLLIFIVLYPAQFIYANFIMSEMLLQTFMFWSFYNFVLFVRDGNMKNIFLYNLLLTFAVLTKPVLYIFLIPNFLLMIYFFLKNKKLFAPVLYAIIPVIAVLLISFYNYKVTGYFHYCSLRHSNLLAVNSNFILINKLGYQNAEKIFEQNGAYLDTIKDYAFQSQEKERIAMEVISDNLGDYMKFHVKGMIIFFIDPGRFEFAEFFGMRNPANDNIYYALNNSGIYYVYLNEGIPGIIKYFMRLPIQTLLYLVTVIIINLILIISIINFLYVKQVPVQVSLYFFLMIGYICFFSGNVGVLRYKLPLLPMILFSIPFLFEKIKSRQQLRLQKKINTVK